MQYAYQQEFYVNASSDGFLRVNILIWIVKFIVMFYIRECENTAWFFFRLRKIKEIRAYQSIFTASAFLWSNIYLAIDSFCYKRR